MQDFLKITSLAQTIWHDYAYARVIKRKGLTDNTNEILFEMYQPKTGSPRQPYLITKTIESDYFIANAWRDYSHNSRNLDSQYGFDAALEWYIASKIDTLIEPGFLSLTIALEALLERFHQVHSGDYILYKDTFKALRKELKNTVVNQLKGMNIQDKVQDEVIEKLGELNRRSYLNNLKRLLNYWGIIYCDIGITIDEIRDIRNLIIHRGLYGSTTQHDKDRISKAYIGLFVILTRLLLAMLKFGGSYHDPIHNKSINFSQVCSKIGHPSLD